MTTRRGPGEGGIRKRPDGRWEATLDLGYAGGRRQRKYLYGKTRQEVQRKLRTAHRQLEEHGTVGGDRETVGGFLERWLEVAAAPNVRPLTYASYEGIVRQHLVPEIGRKRLAKLRPGDVQALLNQKRETGLSPRRVQRIHAVLRQALNTGIKWGEVTRNVATLVDLPPVSGEPVTVLTPEQARKFLEAARGHRHEVLFTAVLGLGLRQGEALGLQWHDIEFEGTTLVLRVRRALQRQRAAGLVMVEPKSKTSRRTIPLPQLVTRAFFEQRRRQRHEARWAAPDWENTAGLVFTNQHGGPLEPDKVRRSFKKLVKEAGLPDIRFHDLRHACASLLLAQGVPARVIMENLGHSQISLTLNTYAHVIPALRQETAKRMDEILGPGPREKK